MCIRDREVFEPAAFALLFVVAFAVVAAFAAAPFVVDTFFIVVCFDELNQPVWLNC